MRTRTDNSFMPRIGIAQIAIESKTCPNDFRKFYRKNEFLRTDWIFSPLVRIKGIAFP